MTPLCDPRSLFLLAELHSDDEGQPVAYGERTGAVRPAGYCPPRHLKPKPYGVVIDPRALPRFPRKQP